MKKLTMIEVANVIGGTCKETCVSSYKNVMVGGATVCKEVITCTDKHGNPSSVTMKNASATSCGGGGVIN
jgi:hypothetical protein